MTHIKLEHIDNLRRGKKSGAKIGSRKVPHHLYQYEEEKLRRAMKYKYLEISNKERPNLVNIWTKICKVRGWKYICLVKIEGSSEAELIVDKTSQHGDKKSLKEHAKKLAKNYQE